MASGAGGNTGIPEDSMPGSFPAQRWEASGGLLGELGFFGEPLALAKLIHFHKHWKRSECFSQEQEMKLAPFVTNG